MQQNISEFIQRWHGVQLSCATELSSSQTFVLQLCELLGLPEIEAQFKGRGPWKNSLPHILETLEALGKAQSSGGSGPLLDGGSMNPAASLFTPQK
jgi:hypothetical protein